MTTTTITTPRSSLFVQVRTGPPTASVYQSAINLAVKAERLGFHTIWFATRHFGAHSAALPTPFPLLAAVAQHTNRIRVGSGVVALPFENPVRLVEDAVVTDELSDGRLELGIGKGLGFGLSAATYAGFGLAQDDREALYTSRREALHRLLETGRVAPGVPVHPDPRSLRARVWQSTGNPETARHAARAGDGLLAHTASEAVGRGGADELIEAYLDAFRPHGPGHPSPRVGGTIAVVPGKSDTDARQIFDLDIATSPAYYSDKLDDRDAATYRDDLAIHCGDASAVVDAIRNSPLVTRSTDWLFHVPLALDHARYGECMARIAEQIVPALSVLRTQHI